MATDDGTLKATKINYTTKKYCRWYSGSDLNDTDDAMRAKLEN